MTVQQTNRMIAEYDSLFITFIKTASSPEGEWMAYDNVSHKGYTSLKYHSSIEWLYPVARKVSDELIRSWVNSGMLNEAHSLREALQREAGYFEIDRLYPVVVSAIEFLNKHKEE